MRLHLERDNLNDEKQVCTAKLSNLEGTELKCVVAKKRRSVMQRTKSSRYSRVRDEGSSSDDEI